MRTGERLLELGLRDDIADLAGKFKIPAAGSSLRCPKLGYFYPYNVADSRASKGTVLFGHTVADQAQGRRGTGKGFTVTLIGDNVSVTAGHLRARKGLAITVPGHHFHGITRGGNAVIKGPVGAFLDVVHCTEKHPEGHAGPDVAILVGPFPVVA